MILLHYGFSLKGRRRLEISADLFNLTNRTNFANPGNDQASATPRPLVGGTSKAGQVR